MTQNDPDVSKNVRLFVGSISKQLADTIEDLSSRFEKYGKIITPIELHKNQPWIHTLHILLLILLLNSI